MGNQQLGGEANAAQVFTPDDLKKLHKRFKKLDKDNSGQLEPNEFFDVPSLSQNPLVKRVISVFDTDKDGKISFMEFITGLASLSTSSNDKEKLKFAFKVYDFDEDGFISNGDLFTVLKIMVGDGLKDAQLQQLVDRTIVRADKDGDGLISFDEFCEMVKELDVASKLTIKYNA